MKKLRIYLDTSVINFLFADDAPDLKKITEELFQDFVRKEKYLFYVSEIVIKEIEKTTDDSHRINLLKVIKDYNLRIGLFLPLNVNKSDGGYG
jgi:predicted HAD superfamily hydrolase